MFVYLSLVVFLIALVVGVLVVHGGGRQSVLVVEETGLVLLLLQHLRHIHPLLLLLLHLTTINFRTMASKPLRVVSIESVILLTLLVRNSELLGCVECLLMTCTRTCTCRLLRVPTVSHVPVRLRQVLWLRSRNQGAIVIVLLWPLVVHVVGVGGSGGVVLLVIAVARAVRWHHPRARVGHPFVEVVAHLVLRGLVVVRRVELLLAVVLVQ